MEKIIHQIWLQGENNIPEKYNDNIKSIKKINKNYEYILWDEIKILNLIKSDKKILDTYYKFSYMHQKIDFAKYVILYKLGGIYIDIDAEALKPINLLVKKFNNYDLIISYINSNILEKWLVCGSSNCYNNGIILAKKNNNIMKKLIDYIVEYPSCYDLNFKVICINNTTGPNIFSKVIKENLDDKTLVLPYNYLEPCLYTNCDVTDETYIKHKHELSWMSINVKNLIQSYLKNRWLFIIIFLLVIFIIYRKMKT